MEKRCEGVAEDGVLRKAVCRRFPGSRTLACSSRRLCSRPDASRVLRNLGGEVRAVWGRSLHFPITTPATNSVMLSQASSMPVLVAAETPSTWQSRGRTIREQSAARQPGRCSPPYLGAPHAVVPATHKLERASVLHARFARRNEQVAVALREVGGEGGLYAWRNGREWWLLHEADLVDKNHIGKLNNAALDALRRGGGGSVVGACERQRRP